MLPNEYIDHLFETKDLDEAFATKKNIGWHCIDGALVIFDLDDMPPWLPTEKDRDDDGNTKWGRQNEVIVGKQ